MWVTKRLDIKATLCLKERVWADPERECGVIADCFLGTAAHSLLGAVRPIAPCERKHRLFLVLWAARPKYASCGVNLGRCFSVQETSCLSLLPTFPAVLRVQPDLFWNLSKIQPSWPWVSVQYLSPASPCCSAETASLELSLLFSVSCCFCSSLYSSRTLCSL